MSDLRATASGKVPDPASHSEVSASQARADNIEVTQPTSTSTSPLHPSRAFAFVTYTYMCSHKEVPERPPPRRDDYEHARWLEMPSNDADDCGANNHTDQTSPGTPPLVCQLPVIPREPYQRSHSIPDLTSLTRLSAYLTPMATFTRTQASQPAASVTKLPILPNTIAIVQHKQDNICKYLQPQAVWI